MTQILVILYFGYQAIDTGDFTTYRTIYAFINYSAMLLDAIDLIMESVEVLEDALVAAKWVFEFLYLEEESIDFDSEVEKLNGQVEFKNLSFKYQPDLPYVLKNINFEAKTHQTIAFVGHTGSGKTTTSLLMRFYDNYEGSIKVDGNELNELSKKAFRKQVGIVLQDPILFKGSIKFNISLNDPNVSDEW